MKRILFFLQIMIAVPVIATGQIIYTIAGNGTAVSGGDGGAATAAGIDGPGGIVIDTFNNIYIAEYYPGNIRKVSPATGLITTIAGIGIPGYSGDGGPATLAKLNKPSQMAFDNVGNLYIADLQNNRIRKISPLGIITTVAGNGTMGYTGDGGPATAAALFHPPGVTVDASGNILIADYDNHAVRKISTSGIITTIAGNGIAGSSGDGGMATAARLNRPWGVHLDSYGNIYISDQLNHKIRKISTSGIITTFAGIGSAGYSGDGGPATAAQLNQPSSVRFDLSGNAYIADQLNNRVRKVTVSGIITTIAGNGTAGYSGDGGLATAAGIYSTNDILFDTGWHLLINDNRNNRIRILSDCIGTITTHPAHDTVFAGIDAKYSVATSMPSPSYQWQEDPGSGFVNLANVWPYSGVFTDTLTIDNTSIFLHATHYRCLITNGFCIDTSNAAILIVRTPTSVQPFSSEFINIYPNPTHDKLHIKIADQTSALNIQLINELGQLISEQETASGLATINLSGLPSSMYIIRLQTGGQTVYKKVFKN